MDGKDKKGLMARRLVYYCIGVLTVAGVWAMSLKTVAVVLDRDVDLSDVLLFLGGAFGAELLMLLLKRIYAKENETQEETEE